MFSSLPDYPRSAETVLQPPREGNEGKAADRIGRMLFRLAILAGLWGVVLYARWMIVSDMIPAQNLPEAVLGKWQSDRMDGRSFIEFTPNHQLRLVGNGTTIESADYEIVGGELMIWRFQHPPGDRDLELGQQCYQISVRGNQLAVTVSDRGITPIPEHTQFEPSSLRLLLPFWQGYTVQFQRWEIANSPRKNVAIAP